jgi:hypothetical protein
MRTRNLSMAYFCFFAVILAACFLAALPGKASAWSCNPNVNTSICTESHDQQEPQITSDGSDGAIIAWQDNRSGNWDIYAQRVHASGTPQWTDCGVGICMASNSQEYPQITSDGSGGAIIAWKDYRNNTDYDIYAQRVDALGDTKWTADGVGICTASDSQEYPQITSDGSGGAIIAWRDNRNGNYDIYAQKIYQDGRLAHNRLPFLPLLLLE